MPKKKNIKKNNVKKASKKSSSKNAADTGKSAKKNNKDVKKPAKKTTKKIQLNEKIRLEHSKHTYKQAINKRYGKYTAKVTKPTYLVFKVIVSLLMFCALLLAGLFVVFGRDLPDVSQLKTMNFSETTVIYDREGNILYRVFSEENRKYVPLSYISDQAIKATLSVEDKNFYNHFGFDAVGMVRAQLKNIEEDEIKQGASTITQQLAKNIFLSPERTYERKIKEFLIALQIESMFSKDEILEMYLNKISYGSNAYGIEAASKTFFGKSSNDLSLAESAVLASLPKAPSYYSPYGQNKLELMGYCKTTDELVEENRIPVDIMDEDPSEIIPEVTEEPLDPLAESLEPVVENAPVLEGPKTPAVLLCKSPDDANYVKGRKDLVLERMLEDGYISKQQVQQAWEESFDLEFKDPVHKIESPHFVFYVKEYLEKKYGKELVESGGLEVVTTLDPKLQSLAENIVSQQIQTNRQKFGANNAAMVALDPKTGQVLAMVGSADYWDPEIDGQVNVVTSPRQPGSSFKPLVYAAAIQNGGIGSGTILSDSRTKFERDYVPRNSDNQYKGRMTVRTALAQSRNIPAIKAFYIAGEEEKLLDFLDKMGVTTLRKFKNEFNEKSEERGWTFNYGPALAIGSGEVTLLELVGGYATLANNGNHMEINPILEIRDRDGNIIEQFEPAGEQVMDPQSAYIVNNILSDAYARPGGTWRAGLTIPEHTVAAKTGTSNKKIGKVNYPNNLLTLGYTQNIAAGFWTGNTDGSQLYYNAWGLTAAAPMWKNFMTSVLADVPDQPFSEPEGLIWKGKEVFPSFMQNTNYDKIFKSEIKEEEEDDEVEKDEAGVPVETFVGEKIEEESGAVADETGEDTGEDEMEAIIEEVYIPESDVVPDPNFPGPPANVDVPELPPVNTGSETHSSAGSAEYGF